MWNCQKTMNLRVKKLFFLFFMSISCAAAADSTKEPLNGILIEGIDFSGKSSVCKLLGEKLTKAGIATETNYCYLSTHPLVSFILKKAIESTDIEEESNYHACATILDRVLFRPKPGTFYIQDRNWYTQACWLKFFAKNYAPENYLFNTHQKFKWNVFLTISYDTLKGRYEQRLKKSSLNKLLFENQDTFIKYTDLCLSHFPDDEKWIVINTDYLSVEQVTEKILNFCSIPQCNDLKN